MGSSLKLCLLAEGGADLYPRLGPTSEWDIAAAHAVLTAAGGALWRLDGEPIVYNKRAVPEPGFHRGCRRRPFPGQTGCQDPKVL